MRLFFVYLLTGLLLGACGNQPAPEKAADTPADPSVHHTVILSAGQLKIGGIEMGAVTERPLSGLLQVNGTVEVPPQHVVSVTMPMGGYVQQMKLLPGSQVSKGQLLATLEDPQYVQLQQDYLVAVSRQGFLKTDFDRQTTLNASRANSEKVLQQVSSEYESQQVMVKALSEKLKLIGIDPAGLNERTISRRIPLRAPISGYVTKVNVNNGRYVSPTDILFELVNPQDLHLSLTVFEQDLQKLAIGQRVTGTTNDPADGAFSARVELINRAVGVDRAAEVHCHFLQKSSKLVPGMFMSARVEVKQARVPAVPDEALVKWENNQYVFVVDGPGHFTMTRVKVGGSDEGYTELQTPVEKQIVTRNAYSLLMKLKNAGEE
ncbi:MAG: efflux RND transporter periplasmic adaptor subunit [Candidatus Pseudobacter hemicellulosilyticus]|uniref:Efflux RND transporter periplasmic adaptor subunit n=1 Tax=Candidatus Pseudobacter hemicellulosilyticus TaxID=3121375 RepID=A0AAJ6BJS5_9BACT|nr:MAG: efflux RND transporter periplasmic adaptor subunit [Pseudobacter sp.]